MIKLKSCWKKFSKLLPMNQIKYRQKTGRKADMRLNYQHFLKSLNYRN